MNIMTNLKVYLPNSPASDSHTKVRVEVSNSYYPVVDFVSVDLIHSGKTNRRMKIIQKQQKEKFSIFLEKFRDMNISWN